ncbi:MAG: NAD-dependent DNA ligase LigA [Candidatus Pacebacteria bacterium]|nr:NAD-dependent DNA ligase LigA [Candidatus Paceibacterota bacterium]MDD4074412.1 NAD-dependent DNA ligase LigA [Candidatus Paceibacterota bacterium]
MNEDVKNRIEKLKNLINHHRYLYHVLDKEEISESALDSLKKELFDLELKFPQYITSDSPTQRIGGKPLDFFEKVKRNQIMYSFNDAFSREDMDNWEKRNKKLLSDDDYIEYYCEPKLDGLAIELTYENGILVLGSTRGDGRVGENVTQNIKTIESIPLKISFMDKLIVRGEAVINKKEFEGANKERVANGFTPYANPRNLAAGSIRQLDSKITSERKLDADIYSIVTDLGQKTHEEEHSLLKEFGFKTNNKYNKLCKNMDEVFDFYNYWQENRDSLPYEIDGLVVLINNNNIFKKLGTTGKSPRGGIALKFPLKEAVTIIEDIEIQVGRTGAITPVAILKPVTINGAVISRATLHNEKEIERLGLKIGDTAVVGRAGDVIPEVMKVFPELRTGKEKEFVMPKICPSCNCELVKPEQEVVWRCPNNNCFKRKIGWFKHFVSRGAFDIEGVGPKILEKFLEEGLLSLPSDLFTLKEGDILPLERFAEKSAQKIIENIQNKKSIPFSRFIYSLGIRNVGQKTSYDLAKRFNSIEEIKQANVEELEQINDIGPIVAKSIFEWFNDKENNLFLEKLEKEGVVYYKEETIKNIFSDKVFVLTGTMQSLSRELARERIISLGGNVSNSISKNIDYVIVGENPGQKYDKALEIGLKIINENEFIKMINQ